MEKVKVLVADDHPIVRKGLCAVLNGDSGVEVIGEAEDGRDAVLKVGQLRPDVVVMDIAMPGLGGLEATRLIRKRFPKVRVVILTVYPAVEYMLEAMRAGASGYVVKETGLTQLALAVKDVCSGGAFVCPSISKEGIQEYLRLVEPDQESRRDGE